MSPREISSHVPKIIIELNGEPYEIESDPSLGALLERINAYRGRIAVERNREIVPRAEYDRVMLKHGDQLEVINFVGGG